MSGDNSKDQRLHIQASDKDFPGSGGGDVLNEISAGKVVVKKKVRMTDVALRPDEVDPKTREAIIQDMVENQHYTREMAEQLFNTGAYEAGDITRETTERAESKEGEAQREQKLVEILTTQYGLSAEEAKAIYAEEKARVESEGAKAVEQMAEVGAEKAAGDGVDKVQKSWFARAKEGMMKSIEVGKKAGKFLWRNKEKVAGAIAAGGLVAATGGGVLLVPAAAGLGAGLGKFGRWLTEGGTKVVGDMGKAYLQNKEFRYTVHKSLAEVGKRMFGAKLLVEGGNYIQHTIDKTMGWESSMRTERSMFVQMEKKHQQREAIAQKFETLTELLGEKGSEKYQAAIAEYNKAIADAKLPKSEEELLKRELGLHMRATREEGKLAVKGEKKEMMVILKNRIKAQETWATVAKESLNMILAVGGVATSGATGSAMMWARTGAYEAITAVEKGLKEKKAYEAEGATRFTVGTGEQARTVSALDQNIRRLERRLYGRKTMELTTDQRLEFQARKKALEVHTQKALEKIRPQYEQVQAKIDTLVLGQSDLEFTNASEEDRLRLSQLIDEKEKLYQSVGIQNADRELMRISNALQSGSLYEEQQALSGTERKALEQQLSVLNARKERAQAYEQAEGFGGKSKVIAGTLLHNAKELSLELFGRGHEETLSYNAKTKSYDFGGGSSGGGGERGDGGMNEKARRQAKFMKGVQAWSRVAGFASMAAGSLIRELLHGKDFGPIVMNSQTGMPELAPGQEMTPEVAAQMQKMQEEMSKGLFNKLMEHARGIHEGESGTKGASLAGLENYTLSALGRMKSFTRVVDMPRIACRQILQWDQQATDYVGDKIDWAAAKLDFGGGTPASESIVEAGGAIQKDEQVEVDYNKLTQAAGVESMGMMLEDDKDGLQRVDAVKGLIEKLANDYPGSKKEYVKFLEDYAAKALVFGNTEGYPPNMTPEQWAHDMVKAAEKKYHDDEIGKLQAQFQENARAIREAEKLAAQRLKETPSIEAVSDVEVGGGVKVSEFKAGEVISDGRFGAMLKVLYKDPGVPENPSEQFVQSTVRRFLPGKTEEFYKQFEPRPDGGPMITICDKNGEPTYEQFLFIPKTNTLVRFDSSGDDIKIIEVLNARGGGESKSSSAESDIGRELARLAKTGEKIQAELTSAEKQVEIAQLRDELPDWQVKRDQAKATADALKEEWELAQRELIMLQQKQKAYGAIEPDNAQKLELYHAEEKVKNAASKYNEANDIYNDLEVNFVEKQNKANRLKFEVAWQQYQTRQGRGYRGTVAERQIGEPREAQVPDIGAKAEYMGTPKSELPHEVKVIINGVEYTIKAQSEEQFKARIGDIAVEIAQEKDYKDKDLETFLQGVAREANVVWDERQQQLEALAAQPGGAGKGEIPLESQRIFPQQEGAEHPDEFVKREVGEHSGLEIQNEEDIKEGMAIFDQAEASLDRLFQEGEITDAKMREANVEYLTSCYEAAMRKLGGELKLGRAATVDEFVKEWGKGHEYSFPKIKAKMEAGTLTLADLVQANVEDRRERIQREVMPMLQEHPVFRHLPDNVKKGTVHAIELLDLTEGPSRWGKLDKAEWRDRAHARILKVMFGVDKEGNLLDGWDKAPYRPYIEDKYEGMTAEQCKEDVMKIGGWVDLHSRAHIKAIHEHDGVSFIQGTKKGVTEEFIPAVHAMDLPKARELEVWTMAHYFMGEKDIPPPPEPKDIKAQLMDDVAEVEAYLRLEEQARAGKHTAVEVHYSEVLGKIEGPKAETLKDIKAQVELMGFDPDKIAQMKYFNPETKKFVPFFSSDSGFDASKLANIDDFEKFYLVDDQGRTINFRKIFEARPDGSTIEQIVAAGKSGGEQATIFSVTRERFPDGTENMHVSVGENNEIEFAYTGGYGEVDWTELHSDLDKLKDPNTGQINMNADTAFRFANLFGQSMKEGAGASFALKYGEWNFAFGDFEKTGSEEEGAGFKWDTTEISNTNMAWRSDVESKLVIHGDGANEMVLGGAGGEAVRIFGQGNVDSKLVADRFMAMGAPDGGLDAIEKYRLAAGLKDFDVKVDMGAIDRAFSARPGTKEALLAAFIKSANHDLQARLEAGQEAGRFDIASMGEGLDRLKAAELGISLEDLRALQDQQAVALEGGQYTDLETLLGQNPNVARLSEGQKKEATESVLRNWYEQVTGHTPDERFAHIANAFLQSESRMLDQSEAMIAENTGNQLHLIAGQEAYADGYLTQQRTSKGVLIGHQGEKGMWYAGAEQEDIYASSGALRDVGPDAMMTVEMRGQMNKIIAGFERECIMKGFTLGARGAYGKGEFGPGVLVCEGENGQKYTISEVFKGGKREIIVMEAKAKYEANVSDEFKVVGTFKSMPGLNPEKMMDLVKDKIPGASDLKLLTRIGVGVQSKHGFSVGGEFSPEMIGTGTHRLHAGYRKQFGDLAVGGRLELARFGQGGFKLADVSASANYEIGDFNVGGEVSAGGPTGVVVRLNVGNKEIPISLLDLISADPKILAVRMGFEVGKKGFTEALDAITDAQENARLQKLGPLFADSFIENSTVDMELGKKGGELFGLYEKYYALEGAEGMTDADKGKKMTAIVGEMLKKRAEIEKYSGDSHIVHSAIAKHIESLQALHKAQGPSAAEIGKMEEGKTPSEMMWQKQDVGIVTDEGTVKIDYQGSEEKFEVHLSDGMETAADREFAAIGDEKTRHIAMAYRELLKRSHGGDHEDVLARMQDDLRQRMEKHADTVDLFALAQEGILIGDKDEDAAKLFGETHEKLMKDKNFDKLADLVETRIPDKYKSDVRTILRSWQEMPTDEEFKKLVAGEKDMVRAGDMVKERQIALARIEEQRAQLETLFDAAAKERAIANMDEGAILKEVSAKLEGTRAVLTTKELWVIERKMKANGTLTESAAAALRDLRRNAGSKGTTTIRDGVGLEFLRDSLEGKKIRHSPRVTRSIPPSGAPADGYPYAEEVAA